MKSLHIIVCMKPVPDPGRWDKLTLDQETLLLKRDPIQPVMNPLDRNAIESALTLARKHKGTVTLLTMAPPSAEIQLREGIGLGCNRAYLLTDRAFAGADTLATARTLAAAIRKIGAWDLILCGAASLDGSTAQVGPQLAELLSVPDLTHATEVQIKKSVLTVACRREYGTILCETDLPAVVTVDREMNKPPLLTMQGIGRSTAAIIDVWNRTDLGLTETECGLAGSPSKMSAMSVVEFKRKGIILRGSPQEVTHQLLDKLRQDGLSLVPGA